MADGMDTLKLLLPGRRQSLTIEVPKGTTFGEIKRIKEKIARTVSGAVDAKILINGQPPLDEDIAAIEAAFRGEGVAARVGAKFASDDTVLADGDVAVVAREQKGGTLARK